MLVCFKGPQVGVDLKVGPPFSPTKIYTDTMPGGGGMLGRTD